MKHTLQSAKEEFEKANIRVQNLESELTDVKHKLAAEKKYGSEENFILKPVTSKGNLITCNSSIIKK